MGDARWALYVDVCILEFRLFKSALMSFDVRKSFKREASRVFLREVEACPGGSIASVVFASHCIVLGCDGIVVTNASWVLSHSQSTNAPSSDAVDTER
jgi:hypothetical protein